MTVTVNPGRTGYFEVYFQLAGLKHSRLGCIYEVDPPKHGSQTSFSYLWDNWRSRSKFRSRTFTRGSPRKPKVRPSVCSLMSCEI